MKGFQSRKFLLTILILSLASLFLYLGKLSGGEWITLSTLIMGMYKAANVTEKKNET